jgi:uncharacterized protein (DUF1015 family)
MEEIKDITLREETQPLEVVSESLTPDEFLKIQDRFGIKYTTSTPDWTPRQETEMVIYFDNTDYWLYIYANGGWRSQKLGVT